MVDRAGPALQIAGQLVRRARQSEILVSQTVRDIVVGTEIVLQGCGEAQFADIAGRWQVYTVCAGGSH